MENMITISTEEYKELVRKVLEFEFAKKEEALETKIADKYVWDIDELESDNKKLREELEDQKNSMIFWYERYCKLEKELKELKGEDDEI